MRTLLLAFLTCVALPAGAEPWKVVHEDDGIRVERRTPEAESFDEFRAQAHSDLAVEAFDAYIFGRYLDSPGDGITRQWLRRGKEEGLWYDRVKNKLVSDRDLVVRYTRHFDPETRVLRMEVASSPDEGPKAQPGTVRLRVRSSWTFTPSKKGGTDITYAVFTDIGGSVSAWMVRGALRDETVERMKKVLSEARSPK